MNGMIRIKYYFNQKDVLITYKSKPNYKSLQMFLIIEQMRTIPLFCALLPEDKVSEAISCKNFNLKLLITKQQLKGE